MSKIYEALRQAELDRAKPSESGVETPSRDAAPEQPQVAIFEPAYVAPEPIRDVRREPVHTPFLDPVRDRLLDPMHEPAPAAIYSAHPIPGISNPLPPSEPIPVPAERIDEIASAPIDAHALDLTGIRAYRWTPAFDQLPALQDRGPGVEQFRSLRSRMYEFRDLNNLKSVLVSSGLPQEGKTFVAANLAMAFARHKAARVLLIDGDMRRSRLHLVLGTNQGPGLTEYLSGKCSLSEIMQRADPTGQEILPTGLASLTFIPGGLDHNKAADLSGNHRFDRLIESVAPFFDWIVVDSSPVNLVSDGVNLARACDAALLVARGAVTKYEDAQRALGELKASKVLGFVLNAVSDPGEAGGYYGYDSYEPYAPPSEGQQEAVGSSAR